MKNAKRYVQRVASILLILPYAVFHAFTFCMLGAALAAILRLGFSNGSVDMVDWFTVLAALCFLGARSTESWRDVGTRWWHDTGNRRVMELEIHEDGRCHIRKQPKDLDIHILRAGDNPSWIQ